MYICEQESDGRANFIPSPTSMHAVASRTRFLIATTTAGGTEVAGEGLCMYVMKLNSRRILPFKRKVKVYQNLSIKVMLLC
jgi:hypothetical protein